MVMGWSRGCEFGLFFSEQTERKNSPDHLEGLLRRAVSLGRKSIWAAPFEDSHTGSTEKPAPSSLKRASAQMFPIGVHKGSQAPRVREHCLPSTWSALGWSSTMNMERNSDGGTRRWKGQPSSGSKDRLFAFWRQLYTPSTWFPAGSPGPPLGVC